MELLIKKRVADKIENTKQVLKTLFIHCSIHNNSCNIYPVILTIICCNICLFILIATVHLSTKAAISHPTSKIVHILTIGNSKKMFIVLNTDSLRNK